MDSKNAQTPQANQTIRDIFPSRLKALREAIGISQDALAKALGVSRATIGYYENGSRLPDIAFLDELVSKSGCNINYLLGHTDYMNEEYESLGEATELGDDEIERLIELSNRKSFRYFLTNEKTWELFYSMDSMIQEIWNKPKVREVLYYSLCNDFRIIAEDIYEKHKIVQALGKEDYTQNELMKLMESSQERYEQLKKEIEQFQAEMRKKADKDLEESIASRQRGEIDPLEAFQFKMGKLYHEEREKKEKMQRGEE